MIAALMVDPELPAEVMGRLAEGDFFREKNGTVYAAIAAVHNRGEVANMVTVAHELARLDRLEGVGGMTYLSDVIQQLPSHIGAMFYADIVRKCAINRELIHTATGIMQMAYANPPDVRATLDRAATMVLGVGGTIVGDRAQTAEQIMLDAGPNGRSLFDELEAHMEEPWKLAGMSTGIRGLDFLTDGYQPGNVYVYAAETSLGKSQFAFDRILYQLLQGRSATMFATEMSKKQVVSRLTYMQAAIDRIQRRRENHYNQDHRFAMRDAMEKVRSLPFVVVPAAGMSVNQFRAECRRWESRGMTDHIVVDHMDHLTGTTSRPVDTVSEVMAGAKGVAEDYGACMHLVSHMNRKTDAGQSKLSRLLNGGAKERDADGVIFIVPVKRTEGGEVVEMLSDEARSTVASRGGVLVDIEVAKMRGGSVGTISAYQDWRNHGGKFFAVDPVGESAGQGELL